MKINGIQLPDNCTLSFHANGVKVSVTINISQELVKHMAKNNVWKGKKMHVYFLSKEIPLGKATPKNMLKTYDYLLRKAMYNVRVGKLLLLRAQMKSLKERKFTLNF